MLFSPENKKQDEKNNNNPRNRIVKRVDRHNGQIDREKEFRDDFCRKCKILNNRSKADLAQA